MHHALRPSSLAVAAAIAILAPASSHAAELTSGLVQGREMRYAFEHAIEVRQREGEGEVRSTTLEYMVQLDITVGAVSTDGSAMLTANFRSFRARYEEPAGPTSIAFDLTREQDEDAEGVGALGAALANRLVIAVDSEGRVRGVSGLDPALTIVNELVTGDEAMPQELFAFIRPDRLREQLSLLFTAEGGLGEREDGESWTSERSVPLGPAGALLLSTETTLGSATDLTAELAATTSVTHRSTPGTDPTLKVELGEARGETLTVWDVDDGGLLTRADKQTIETNWTRGDIALRQVQESENEIRIVALD